MTNDRTRHMQTSEGQRHSAEARQRRLAELPVKTAPRVFVVRIAGTKPFGWEIRKFGSFVLSRSETGFTTQPLAQTAGEKALAALTPA